MTAKSFSKLSVRELAALRRLAEGDSRKMIAGELGVAEGTVRSMMQRIYEKMGVHDKVAATRKAIREGLVVL